MKVRPHIPQLESIQLTLNTNPDTSPSCSGSMDSLDTDTLTMEAMEESLNYTTNFKSSNIKVYTRQLQEVSPSLPATIMMDEEFVGSGDEELSSPRDYALASPNDMHDMQDMQDMHDMDDLHDMNDTQDTRDTDERDQSPQSPASQDNNSDIEVDV